MTVNTKLSPVGYPNWKVKLIIAVSRMLKVPVDVRARPYTAFK